MKCELILEIRNLHACPGDGPPKRLKVPKDVLSQIDVTTTKAEVDEELAREDEKAKSTEKTRVTIQPCHAFRENDGEIVFRLGGSYGKLMGLFREVGSLLYTQKIEGFKTAYKAFLKAIIIKPQWIKLEEVSGIEINKVPQITAGRNRAFILKYYEAIPKCKARMNIQVPEGGKERFEKLIETAEGIPFGPTRRGEIKILELNWEKVNL